MDSGAEDTFTFVPRARPFWAFPTVKDFSWVRADGSATTVTLTVDVTPGPRPPMKLAAKAVTRRLAAANMKMLDALAAAARRVEDS